MQKNDPIRTKSHTNVNKNVDQQLFQVKYNFKQHILI